ncbi:MAG: hypothetical protein EXS69_00910 [Candidatus Zambryskibacteria bacterium]|nr:hypothetical protein [Candidatus Zambryskibacteria bacterium]
MSKIKFNYNQLELPFGERRSKAISIDDRQRMFWFLTTTSLLSLIVYIYAINATAHHIAVRENLEKKVVEMADNLGTLSFDYIELANAVTIETAHEYGFKEVKQPLYVTRGAGDSLTLNTVKR